MLYKPSYVLCDAQRKKYVLKSEQFRPIVLGILFDKRGMQSIAEKKCDFVDSLKFAVTSKRIRRRLFDHLRILSSPPPLYIHQCVGYLYTHKFKIICRKYKQ